MARNFDASAYRGALQHEEPCKFINPLIQGEQVNILSFILLLLMAHDHVLGMSYTLVACSVGINSRNTRTRTRTNTNPNGTAANAAG